jgi:hypothetical protein
VTLGVRARRADRRHRGERAHAAWCVGSPAETRPGGACGAEACRAHARTPRRGHGTTAHGGGAAATRGRARVRDVASAFPPSIRGMCPYSFARFSKNCK